MIFASSDVASVLHRWEVAEYVSEGFVIVGCAGELVADFFTKLPERIRRHIGSWSTIVLILALSVGLKCLIKTNELSGSVIGSLGDKAAEADRKAEKAISDSSTAFSQATDALTRARKAEESLGKAENEAKDARNAASNALTIAGNARKEADSFENDIIFAKKQAAEAQAELNRLKTPRSLTNASDFVTALQGFKGTEYTFSSVAEDEESINLLKEIDSVLQLAGWKRVKPPGGFPAINVYGKDVDFSVVVSLQTGVHLSVDSSESLASLTSMPNKSLPTHIWAAETLSLVLSPHLSPSQEGIIQVNVEHGTSTTVRIAVGKKP
ncbi:MAG: hypothetical protein WCA89_15620 [Terracidiphilus sp.]|jgi:hypothetical protein